VVSTTESSFSVPEVGNPISGMEENNRDPTLSTNETVQVSPNEQEKLNKLSFTEILRKPTVGQQAFLEEGTPLAEQLVRWLKRSRSSGSINFVSRFSPSRKRPTGSKDEGKDQIVGVNIERNFVSILTSWGFSLRFWNGYGVRSPSSRRTFEHMGEYLYRVSCNNGAMYCIKLLKITLFCVHKYLAGQPLDSTYTFGISITLRNGLPKWLPMEVRSFIRDRNIRMIRIYTSILNMFKGLKGSYSSVNYSTIMSEPFTENLDYLDHIVDAFWESLGSPKFDISDTPGRDPMSRSFTNAGPLGRWSLSKAEAQAAVWDLSHEEGILLGWLRQTGQFKLLSQYLKAQTQYLDKFGSNFDRLPGLGALALKYEPAGKIRVFALIDIWTQLSMSRVHDWMFSVLRRIPSDATFDQEGSLLEHVNESGMTHYNLDLTAATDLIPKPLYVKLFSKVMGQELAEAWAAMITERNFLFPPSERPKDFGDKSKDLPFDETHWGNPWSVKYTRGQPMGALSSWAALALVHHFVVFYANRLIRLGRIFMDYRILGDDVTISDHLLALSYQDRCVELGIKFSAHKSIISLIEGFVHFANKVYLKRINISPASFREELAVVGLNGRVEYVRRLMRNGVFSNIDSKVDVGSQNTSYFTAATPDSPSISSIYRGLFNPNQWILETLALTRGTISMGGFSGLMSILYGEVVSGISRTKTPTNRQAFNIFTNLLVSVRSNVLAISGLSPDINWVREEDKIGNFDENVYSVAYSLLTDLYIEFQVRRMYLEEHWVTELYPAYYHRFSSRWSENSPFGNDDYYYNYFYSIAQGCLLDPSDELDPSTISGCFNSIELLNNIISKLPTIVDLSEALTPEERESSPPSRVSQDFERFLETLYDVRAGNEVLGPDWFESIINSQQRAEIDMYRSLIRSLPSSRDDLTPRYLNMLFACHSYYEQRAWA